MHGIEQLELHTERLVLKVLGPDFAQQSLEYYTRNRAFLAEWNPLPTADFYTLPYHQERLRAEFSMIAEGRMARFWLFKRTDAAYTTAIGNIAFNNIVRGAFQSCHLGYQLDEREINQGFITEALRRAIDYAFEDLQLHRIEANIMPRNQRSRRVVEKLGFVEEGLARQYLKINGVWEDHIHYVLLNDAV
ncbi:MAG TPA: GNAT family N-acetyltransferase [Roseiflexaceae bacterium]|nr:GNAT family N-acetyltransferase [Roseiflexaceae bacterium]